MRHRCGDAVGYIRVSTARQGRSGLGLEAQQAAIARFAEAEAFNLVETFTETESGADDDRPQLSGAIERARKVKAPVIVAKFDRLSRDVALHRGPDEVEGPVHRDRARRRYRPLPPPHLCRACREGARADLAAGRRTRWPLRARGVVLGGLRDKGRSSGRGWARAEALRPVLRELAALSQNGRLRRALNERGITTTEGKSWHAQQVLRVRSRLGL